MLSTEASSLRVCPWGTSTAMALYRAAEGAEGESGATVYWWNWWEHFWMLGCERHFVRLIPYQSDWAELFQQEALALRRAIGDQTVRIEHVGSTAIPGLDAKPILDIVVAVRDMADATAFEESLLPLGYVHKAENDRPGRLYFVKRTADNRSTHHLNITELGTECWFTHVAFRDYLRSHPKARDGYQGLKRELASRHQHDRAAYQDGKAEFIEHVLSLAGEGRILTT